MAVYAPTGLSYDGPAVQLGQQLVPALLGVRSFAATGDRSLLPAYNLLGDPGLTIQ